MFSYSLAGLEVDESAETVLEVEENETTARSAFYQLLGKAFSTPDADYFSRANDGLISKEFTEAAGELPFAVPLAESAPAIGDTTPEQFEAEYIRIFDVGSDGPPCPLFGGTYTSDRMGAMEEVVRFYDYFGLKTGAEGALPPDHITIELDFMQYLTFKEAATASPRLARSYINAQKDFLDRQLTTWLPEMTEKLAAADPHPFFKWIGDLTLAYAQTDLEYVLGNLG